MTRNKHATHVRLLVLKAMTRNKHATHVRLLVLKGMTRNKQATHYIRVLPYIGYMVCAAPSIRVFVPFLSGIGYGFRGNYGSL